MKRFPTLVLRIALVVLALVVGGLCALVLPAIFLDWGAEFPSIAYMRYPIVIILGISAIVFWIALMQAYKLLGYIDGNRAFSEYSVRALSAIKKCGATIAFLFALLMPLIYYVAEIDDAPGLIIFGSLFVFAPVVVAVFAGVMQGVLHNAIALQTEHDLTV